MQKIKKTPLRQCMGCRNRSEKNALIRIVCTPEKKLEYDPTGRKNGRGAYVCKNTECLNKALKSGSIKNAFQMDIKNEDIERLIFEMESINEIK